MKGRVSARSLEELIDNWMLFKGMWWKGFSDEEMERLPAVLVEETRKLETFRETDGGVEIETAAWIGFAWK